MTSRSLPEDVLDRWLAGTATPDDRRLVDQWIETDPARTMELDALRAATHDSFPWTPASATRVAALKAAVRGKVQASGPVVVRGYQNGRSVILRLSAALAVLLAAVGVGTMLRPHTGTARAPRVYRTGAAQRADLTLADGSRVRLAPMSTLTVPAELADPRAADHAVVLSGEALFDVAPSSRTAFLVHTGAVSTRVLGTTFDVSAYTADPHVRVAVVSGKVVVAASGRASVVTAGQMARVGDSTITTADVADMATYTAWTDGTLVFRRTSVSDLLQRLGQWYGLRFVANDSSITSGHITVTFDHKTQSEMLRVLTDLLHVSATFAPDAQGVIVVTLHPQRVPSHTSRRDATLDGDMTREVGR